MSQISLTWQSISLPAFSHLITHSPGLKVEANFSEVCFCSPSSHRANWHLMWSSHYISPKTEEKTRWRKEPLKASLAQFLTQLPTLSWVCPLYPSLPPPQEGSELAKLTMVRPSAEHKGKPNRFVFFFFCPQECIMDKSGQFQLQCKVKCAKCCNVDIRRNHCGRTDGGREFQMVKIQRIYLWVKPRKMGNTNDG